MIPLLPHIRRAQFRVIDGGPAPAPAPVPSAPFSLDAARLAAIPKIRRAVARRGFPLRPEGPADGTEAA
ncbi:hypothetical protein [Wenxinia saemankumensis]|uniref:Uncharacterized protein n=1 Tax=Wenxinia saemankumensis TaxID=1447782 RepID=A0A1M6EYR1_9RHOB|nr:hypothetical protein [Wenxinia saemankumensis]SHI90597.1 hypothetical protein SAMN05444417_2253 [Wenxinia saemankumensis]